MVRVRAFDHLTVEILSKNIEFRRQIILMFVQKVQMAPSNTDYIGEGSLLHDALLRKPKKKKGKDL